MTHSQFSLSWDSHKMNICGGFCSLQQNGEFVDMTLAADGHFVKVHQALIALSSPYLKELITSAPCPHPVIFLNNVSKSTLTLLMEYIYTGEVLVPQANLTEFMEAAKSLHIKGLESIQNDKVGIEQRASDVLGTPAKKRKSDLAEQALKLPAIARKISIKPESSYNSSMVKNYTNTVADKDDENDYPIDFETHDSDDGGSYYPQDTSKSTDIGVKSSNLQFTVSIRGSLQVILNRFMYNLQSTQSSGVKRWRCIDYRNMKCMAFLVTKDNVVLNRGNPHCHSFHDKKILQKIEKNAVYSALYELEAHQEREREKQNDDEANQSVEYISSEVSGELPDLTDTSKTDK